MAQYSFDAYCERCREEAEFEYVQETPDTVDFFECPNCGLTIDVDDAMVPIPIRQAMKVPIFEKTCRFCGRVGEDVEERWSFGVPAGRLCLKCCRGYRDGCGVDQEQGNPADLDEQLEEN